jgi:hypothetical protein
MPARTVKLCALTISILAALWRFRQLDRDPPLISPSTGERSDPGFERLPQPPVAFCLAGVMIAVALPQWSVGERSSGYQMKTWPKILNDRILAQFS